MTGPRVWFGRLAGLFRRAQRDLALREEIQSHLDHLADDFVRHGMAPAEARAAARRSFGAVDAVEEAYRDQRGVPLLDTFSQDARFAGRLVRRQPGFAATAILTLALGIGLDTTFFTLINAICLRGLPIERPGEVLYVSSLDPRGHTAGLSYLDVADATAGTTSFRGLGAYANAAMVIGDENTPPDRVAGTYISAGAFGLLGRPPVIGREFSADDHIPGAARVVLLGHAVWASRYGADPGVVGREVDVNGEPATVVGVMPDRFRFPIDTGLWLPLTSMPGITDTARDARRLAVFGRLADGITQDDARADLEALGGRLSRVHPDTNRDVRFTAIPINDQFNGRITDPGWLSFMAAGLIVLLAACANVANLLVMRSAARARELAIRTSIGASRGRLVRQLLVESAILSALGGIAGVAISLGALRLLRASVPASAPLPFWIDFTVDTRVLVVVLGLSVATVFICGFLPAWQASHRRVTLALRSSGLGAATARGRRLSSGLLALQIGLSVVLLTQLAIAAGGSVHWGAEPIVDPSRLLVGSIALPAPAYPTAETRVAFHDALRDRLAAVGTINAVAVTSHLPLAGGQPRRLAIEGRSASPGVEPAAVPTIMVGDAYFEVLDLAMLRGRTFEPADGRPGHEATIVNTRFAEIHFPGEDALGRRVRLTPTGAGETSEAGQWLTIVGVAPIVREWSTDSGGPMAYLPFRAEPPDSASLVLSGSDAPSALASTVRDVVHGLDPTLPVSGAMSLEQARHEHGWNGRISASVVFTAAAITFVLALVGLYAVTAYRVIQRTAELGLRLAVGATGHQIAGLVLGGAIRHLAVGGVLGLGLVVAMSRLFPAPTSSEGAVAFGTVLMILALVVAVALVACLGPALRAARIDPIGALRSE